MKKKHKQLVLWGGGAALVLYLLSRKTAKASLIVKTPPSEALIGRYSRRNGVCFDNYLSKQTDELDCLHCEDNPDDEFCFEKP